ncbi:ABC transporter permease [Nocardioides sp. CN2-186]|uniref:ABC transporter permease n=1 Tax=Nocardioides tweenelious TaxID=3156607 RepID=UPI0032B59F2D
MSAAVSANLDADRQTRRSRPRGRAKLVAGAIIVGLFVLAGIFAPLVAPHDPLEQDLLNRLADPSAAHLIGTDALGRDTLSRIIFAIRVDLRVGILCALLPMLLGTVIGALAGFYGGFADTVVTRLIDLVQSFPVLVFFLALLGAMGMARPFLFLGPGELPVIIVFVCVGWIVYARLIRGEILRVRELEYVQAARAGGLSDRRVLVRHVLPNVLNQTLVYVVLDVGLAILALATLSFLGLGIPAPTPEWGAMVAENRARFADQWWLVVAPGLALSVLGVGLALVGDGLDDMLKQS